MAVPVVPMAREHQVGPTMVATTRTVVATRTMIAADSSSCEIPFETEFVDDAPPAPRARGASRRITVGEGVLERVPVRRAWWVPTVVALTGALAVLVVAI